MAKESPDIWMPLYIGDYLGKTMHLSTVEHGAYLLLLMAYWKNGGPIPAEDRKLAAICRVPLSEFSAIRSALEEYFEEEDGKWRNSRADREILKWAEMKEDKGFGAAVANFKRFGTPIPERYAERYAERVGERNAGRIAGRTPSPSPSSLPSPSPKKLLSQGGDGKSGFADFLPTVHRLFGKPSTYQGEVALMQLIPQLVEAKATVKDLEDRVAHYRRCWPEVPCTLKAVLKNWDEIPNLKHKPTKKREEMTQNVDWA